MRIMPHTATTPYLSYSGYENFHLPSLGFDVSERLGLVATATEDCRVKMYGLWTGKAVDVGVKRHHISPSKRYPGGPQGMMQRDNDEHGKESGYMTRDENYAGDLVRCLKFVGRDSEGDSKEYYGMRQNEEGLMVGCGNRVDMWSWSQRLWESRDDPR